MFEKLYLLTFKYQSLNYNDYCRRQFDFCLDMMFNATLQCVPRRELLPERAVAGELMRGIFFLFRRGPIIVTELTTTPTLSAIVEFKNKDDLEKVNQKFSNLLFLLEVIVAILRLILPLSVY